METYYSKNKERILQKVKEYQATRKEHYKQRYREWYAANKEKCNARRREKRLLVPKVKKEKVKKEKPVPEIPVIPILLPPQPESTIEYTGHNFILTFEQMIPAFVIHADSAMDRKPLVDDIVKKTGAIIVEAIMLPYGPEGCTRSHVEVAKLAKELFPHDSYLVFEDDCVLSDGWDEIYKTHLTADIVYLGYNDYCEHTIFGTHALLMSPKARDLFLQQWKRIGETVGNRMATDWILSRLIRDNKLHVVLPTKQSKDLAMQKKGLTSLITKRVRT